MLSFKNVNLRGFRTSQDLDRFNLSTFLHRCYAHLVTGSGLVTLCSVSPLWAGVDNGV